MLGHNGAGKTTTISMLTGLYERTEGKASVYGIDIFNNMDDFRQTLGVCPQHNVLFDQLTPREHLEIFLDFKGISGNDRAKFIDQTLIDVDLVSQADLLSKKLSGGQQRKVNVGIAIIGDPKVILLDEPTSGMDPTARRRLWEMLKELKKDRIIILTTHFMEEADILGDRIAIMVNGNAQCCGSPMFLKERFGVGYNLIIEKTVQIPQPAIDQFVKSFIPDAIKLSEASTESAFQLPNEYRPKFKEFFLQMDA